MPEVGQCEVTVCFPGEDWDKISKACEKLMCRELTKDEVIDMTVAHCRTAMNAFVLMASLSPGYSN